MPKGFEAIKDAAKAIDDKSKQKDDDKYFNAYLRFKLPQDGDSAIVRFLEQGDDVYSYWYHDRSHQRKASGWKTKVPCLDQDDEGVPCPGCQAQWPRKFQGLINVIWRDAPKLKRDADGKIVRDEQDNVIIEGTEDQVAVWASGINLFSKVLARKDVAYKGVTTRDFEVIREGMGLDTTYSVEPADIDAKASKLTGNDKTLADNKYDLKQVANFVSEERFKGIIEASSNGSSDGEDDESLEDIQDFLKTKPFEN